MGIGAIGYLIYSQIAYKFITLSASWGILAAIATFLFSGLAIGLFGFLRGDAAAVDSHFYGGEAEQISDTVRQEVARLKSDLAALKVAKSQGKEASVNLENLRATITPEIVAAVEQRLSVEALAKAQTQEIRAIFANAYTRLSAAIEQLNLRGIVNLIIGVITTVFAAAVLAYMAFKAPATTNPGEILAHYIPRLSTVVFIEVFSFFFLRLYKTTLDDSKFYQLQLLSLTTTDIALQAAMKTGDAAVMAAVISQIARGRADQVPQAGASKSGELDAKGFADLLEKFGKLAIDVSKAKGAGEA
jgi:hypothetical protein